jgi:hypothetical protein
MYVEKLTMKDFRCFEQAEVTFVYPGQKGLPAEALDNVTLLMGINGAGKTSVIRGMALSGLSPIISMSGYFPYHLVRTAADPDLSPAEAVTECTLRGERTSQLTKQLERFRASITIRTVSEINYFWKFSWMGSESGLGQLIQSPFHPPAHPRQVELPEETSLPVLFSEAATDHFILGYGATRRTEYLENLDAQRSRRRHPHFQRVAGLFEDYITLYPLAAWYPTLESKPRQKEVRELLNGLLPDGTEFTGEFKDADALFTHNGVKLPFGALSDGFRSYIGLVADMLYHLNYVCPKKSKLTDLSGVVMIDDIDVHLHPKWQREVVPSLAKTFPKLQFIITSHSPLVAGTLHAANIRVVEDNQIHEYTERIHGLSADQILLSSYFGLDSTRAPAAERKLSTMAKRVADTHDPAPAIAFLEELAGKSNGQKPKKKKS